MATLREHLIQRHLDLNLHHAWIDEENGVASFPMFGATGVYAGYLQYRPSGEKKLKNDKKDGMYFCFRSQAHCGFWGWESLHLSPTIAITEGIFDAARLSSAGISALAICANPMSPSMRELLYILGGGRRIVSGCDGDKAGQRLAKVLPDSFICSPGEDIASIQEDEFEKFLKFAA